MTLTSDRAGTDPVNEAPPTIGEPGTPQASPKSSDPQVELALGWAGDEIREAVLAGVPKGRLNLHARARLWSLSIAQAAGWTFRLRRGSGLLLDRGPHRVWLQPVVVRLGEISPVHPDDLHAALEPLFGRRRWALVLRRPLRAKADVGKVIEPVRQWLARVEQGKWDADYAIYEDAEISIELRLLPGESTGPHGATFRLIAPCTDALLRHTERAMFEVLSTLDDSLPVVPVLVADRPWRLGRNARLTRLYGKLLETRVGSSGQQTLTFRRDEDTWFGSDLGARVPAVWWLAPRPTDPLVPSGWADENPWSGAMAPPMCGERVSVTAVAESESLGAPASLTYLRRHGWIWP
ncbi:MAG: hypothetical protein EA397_03615 [Deltaproteobacteria bacterium]|nr:MAG: hypothetical protein EA397_03615 [Deltaproteobacteria bacterium]